jgi:hypothetical protein
MYKDSVRREFVQHHNIFVVVFEHYFVAVVHLRRFFELMGFLISEFFGYLKGLN